MQSKLIFYLLLALVACRAPAAADSVTLTSSNQNITFTGLGAGDPTQLLVLFGTCNGGGCVLTGNFTGTGMFAGGGTYTLSTSGPIVFTCTAICTASSTSPLVLKLGSITIDFEKGQIRADGTVIIQWKFPESFPLNISVPIGGVMGLLGTTNSLSGQVAVVPEPASLLLFGTGLAVVISLAISRRSMHAQTAPSLADRKLSAVRYFFVKNGLCFFLADRSSF